MINREGFYVGDIDRECTSCGEIFAKTSKTVTLCNVCNSTRVKSESTEIRMWRRAKVRARENIQEFDISVDDIRIPEICPVLNIPLVVNVGRSGGNPNSPALDRIDNSKGYVIGNIQVISHLANQMKSSANPNELLLFSKWIQDTYGKE